MSEPGFSFFFLRFFIIIYIRVRQVRPGRGKNGKITIFAAHRSNQNAILHHIIISWARYRNRERWLHLYLHLYCHSPGCAWEERSLGCKEPMREEVREERRENRLDIQERYERDERDIEFTRRREGFVRIVRFVSSHRNSQRGETLALFTLFWRREVINGLQQIPAQVYKCRRPVCCCCCCLVVWLFGCVEEKWTNKERTMRINKKE